MRKIFLMVLLISTADGFAQCNYYYFQDNKTVTMAHYDRKGNQNGKSIYRISGLAKSGGTTNADVQSEVFDKKGKSVGTANGTMQCKNGQLMMDMKMMLNPQQAQQFKDVSADGKGVYLEYPSSLKEGQTLPDASFDMDVKMESGVAASVSMDITNRKVEGKEKITTPAGNWEAYKITFHNKTIINMGIPIPMNMQMTEWFVPDFGVVKTESKWGTTELVSIQ